MSITVVADTSGIISLTSSTDKNHDRAVAISKRLSRTNGSVIIPGDVFSEILNIAGKKLGHSDSVRIANILLTTKTFLIVDIGEKIRMKALSLFENQPSSVSFTDCIVMATADIYKTKIIFGFDEVFQKNGYSIGEVA
ncbi:MAG: PIN domain-containing protein [Patescibacteria group bacterium]|nr:PIN domain-containing protein [Patescibacteria group bacterium]